MDDWSGSESEIIVRLDAENKQLRAALAGLNVGNSYFGLANFNDPKDYRFQSIDWAYCNYCTWEISLGLPPDHAKDCAVRVAREAQESQ